MQGGYYSNGSLNLRGVRLEQGSIFCIRGKGVESLGSRIIVGERAHERVTSKEQGGVELRVGGLKLRLWRGYWFR